MVVLINELQVSGRTSIQATHVIICFYCISVMSKAANELGFRNLGSVFECGVIPFCSSHKIDKMYTQEKMNKLNNLIK